MSNTTAAPSNARQARDWDGEHGRYWADHADLYDRSVAGYQPALLAAAGPAPDDRILDVGCGSGQLAIDLVRAASGARALGVDLSSALLDVARRRAAGLAVEFLQADAQVHDFGPAAYDLVVSRTGTMFFGDAAAAFANLARATSPGGRLAILVWRGLDENEWLREIFEALRVGRDLPMPLPGAPGPFAQSDPAVVEPLLRAAGWSDVTFDALERSIWLGEDPDHGTRWQLGQSAWILLGTDDAQRATAAANLRALFAAHHTADGVRLSSAAWLITARRAP
ncbi:MULTISPECIES: class I SAM-dependent methyltransferase [Nocardioides]|uniref:Class I SAM-dependent methyltransferase n=1 Tax=Nocardioides vastitatis TaxID=2568655 RepID=A0ABW0ZPJ8_9ACTN|nr:class I SAM-dependent methyltransferase [Nocardioides sp.]THI96071.1 class I SAM-dependent methyltransferase [Nocardioides sp.]